MAGVTKSRRLRRVIPLLMLPVFLAFSTERTEAMSVADSSPAFGNCYPLDAVPSTDRLGRFVRRWVLDITNSIFFDASFDLCSMDEKNVTVAPGPDRIKLIYGKPLFQPMLESPRTNWEAIALLAHEIGHIVLHFNSTQAHSGNIKSIELEADEFAGYILAKLGVPEETLKIFPKYGDNFVDSPQHHGTPTERYRAAEKGWEKEKLGFSYDAKFIPYWYDAEYVLFVSTKETVGVIGGVMGLFATIYGLGVWSLRRLRRRAFEKIRVFISYRRDDAGADAGRIFDHLKEIISENQIFIDVDSIGAGTNFHDAIRKALADCDVLLAVIGRRWTTATDPDGVRRLDRADDFVRLELTTALELKTRIIPVLVQGASMPSKDDLPEALLSLASCNALEIRHPRFASDMNHLVTALTKLPRQKI
jgi:hypothetical protein